MKAIVQTAYGDADVLKIRDVDQPKVEDGAVLIRVHAAGVDPSVIHLMTGLPYAVRLAFGLRKPKSRIRGADVSGTVVAAGAHVGDLTVGDVVFGTCHGAFAEYATAPHDHLATKPTTISFAEAAAVPISATTALQAVRDAGRVQAGQRVLIIGASGGVGAFAVQIAQAHGAHVTGVCSTGKVERVRAMGAVDVIDYTREDLTQRAHGFDLVIDTAGNRPLSLLRRFICATGTVVIVGGEGGGRLIGPAIRNLQATVLSPFVKQRLTGVFGRPRRADLEVLRELIEDGKVTPVIDRTFAFNEAADAVRYLNQGHARGKVVVTVAATAEGSSKARDTSTSRGTP